MATAIVLVGPALVQSPDGYGAPGQKYGCWTVLEHRPSGTGVAYPEQGFGPAFPWGLVFLGGPHMSMGLDSAWYASLEEAVRESGAWDGPNPAGYEVPDPPGRSEATDLALRRWAAPVAV